MLGTMQKGRSNSGALRACRRVCPFAKEDSSQTDWFVVEETSCEFGGAPAGRRSEKPPPARRQDAREAAPLISSENCAVRTRSPSQNCKRSGGALFEVSENLNLDEIRTAAKRASAIAAASQKEFTADQTSRSLTPGRLEKVGTTRLQLAPRHTISDKACSLLENLPQRRATSPRHSLPVGSARHSPRRLRPERAEPVSLPSTRNGSVAGDSPASQIHNKSLCQWVQDEQRKDARLKENCAQRIHALRNELNQLKEKRELMEQKFPDLKHEPKPCELLDRVTTGNAAVRSSSA